MNVLIVDDHPVVRRGLRDIILESFPDAVVTEAANVEEAIGYAKDPLDLAIVDIALPGRDGLEFLVDMRRTRPGVPVLIVSVYHEPAFAIRALRDGAAGYVSKDAASEELVAAVRKTMDGGRYVSSELLDALAGHLQSDANGVRSPSFSRREVQVLRLLAEGLTWRHIAERLTLSEKTVATYRARILAKTGMATTPELIRFAVQTYSPA